MPLRLRHLACGAATLLPLMAATETRAQNITVSSISASGSVGNLVSAPSLTTTLTLAASGGTFTVSGGTGARLTSGSDLYTVTIACAGQPTCDTANANIRIQNAGTPSNRLGALTNFTVAMSTATLIGSPPPPGGVIDFTIGPIGKNSSKTFFVGFDLPLLPDSSGKASGAAATAFQVLAAAAPSSPSGALQSTVNATVFRPISVIKRTDLNFGSIVRPNSGSGTVTMSARGSLSTSAGIILTHSSHSAAAFTVNGEGGQAFSLSVPATVDLVQGANTLTVTTFSSASGAKTLSGALGSGGSLTTFVGGSFPISSTTVTGPYTGTLVVTVAYN